MRSSNCTHGSIGPRTTTTKTAHLALVVHWYAGDLDRLYAKPDQWALRRHDFDLRTAAAALLGHDMRASVSAPEAAVLATRATQADHDLLAQHFAVGRPG